MDLRAPLRLDLSRRAWLSAGAPIIGLVLLLGVLGLLLLVGFARQQDRDYADGTRHLVQGALDGRLRMLDALVVDYANWDAAHQNISVDIDSAWLEDTFYSAVVDALILFRPGESPRFVWVKEGAPVNVTMQVVDAASRVPNLAQLAAAADPAQTVGNTFAAVGSQLAVISVAPITPEDDSARQDLAGRKDTYYLAAVLFMDAQRVAMMGHDLNLRDLRFGPDAGSDSISTPVRAAHGAEIGVLSWPHPYPGSAGLAERVWLVVLALTLAGFLTVYLTRRLVERQVATLVRAESALEASRLKSDFIATMSHELRSPINAIVGYAELIEEECDALGPNAAALREDSARIVAAGRQLSRLVSDIVDQSRLDAGRLALQIETVHAGELLAEVAEIAEPLADASGSRLQVGASDDQVRADHARLRQCLLNLVGHSAKSLRRGLIRLSAALSEDGAFVVFEVSDTGAGIASHEVAKLFDPASGPDENSPGLELAISLKLARAMGGDVSVNSRPGLGTTFKLMVPAVRELQSVQAAA